MKGRTTVEVLLLALLAAGLSAQTSGLPAPDKDPFVGTWQANRDKSVPKLDRRAASYMRTITRQGDYLVFSSQIENRIDNRKKTQNHYKIRCDGAAQLIPAGLVSCKYDAADRIEGETLLPTKETLYWSREVSSDGRVMKIFEYDDAGRTKLKATWILDRLK